MIKFDLQKALKGEPVVLRDGTKAFVRYRETQVKTNYPLIGYVADGKTEGNIMSWTEDGRVFWDREGMWGDIVGMWSKPIVFEHWGLLLEDIKYIAKDDNGRWFGYVRKPSKDEWGWGITLPYTDYYLLAGLDRSLFPDCDWENSLLERPENV